MDEPCQVVEEGFLIEIRLERQAGNYDVEIVREMCRIYTNFR